MRHQKISRRLLWARSLNWVRILSWAGAMLLPALRSFGQCGPPDTAGLQTLTVLTVTDTSVTFNWSGVLPGQTYGYTVTTDPTFNGILGDSNFVYSINYTQDSSGTVGGLQPGTTYWVFVWNTLCSSLDSVRFVTKPNPCRPGAVPVPTITSSFGSDTVCGGSGTLLLTSSSPSGNSWYYNGVRVDSGATSWLAGQSGSYWVIVLYPNGCTDTSAIHSVVLDPGPPTPVVTASGNTEICKGSSVTLSSSASAGNQWYEGNTALPGQVGASYLADTAGVFWVQVKDQFGCWANSADLTVTINPASIGNVVTPTISPVGPLTVCTDSTVLLISSAAVNYQWFWDGDAIAGGNGDTLAVTVTGSYSVATGTAGCGSLGTMSAPVAVTYVDQLQPTITMVSGVLVSSYTTGNQWYLNDSVLQGATHQQYTPRVPGTYRVRVGVGVQTVDTTTFQIEVGGCYSQFSPPWVIADSNLVVPQVIVYPNPVSGVLTLTNKASGRVTVRIFNLTGQQVFAVQGMVGTLQVDVSGWGKGAYFVQIIDQGSQLQEKAVVLKL